MVLAHHGVSVPLERLRQLSETTETGTDLSGLSRAAEAAGFDPIAAELSYDELLSPDLWPAILHWDGDHFVVLTELSPDRAVVLDPAFGERRMDREVFESHRSGAGRSRAGLVVLPRLGDDVAAGTRGGASGGTGQLRDASLPFVLWAVVLLYAGLLSGGVYVLIHGLRQAVDLQFREGWVGHVGGVLLAVAALVLGHYLVRRACVGYAARQGKVQVSSLRAYLKRAHADRGQRSSEDFAVRIAADVDEVRVWRAYRFPEVLVGCASVAVALAFGAAIDSVLGLAATGVVAVLAILSQYLKIADPTRSGEAINAQVAQREATREYALLLPEVLRSGRPDAWLSDRLLRSNEQTSSIFVGFVADVIARAELRRIAGYLGSAFLFAVALYRLGYAGLQVGELLVVSLLWALVVHHFSLITAATAAFAKTREARLRLTDLETESPPRDREWSGRPQNSLYVTWSKPGSAIQRLSFTSPGQLALVGSDVVTRDAVIAGLLGLPNPLSATLSESADAYVPADSRPLGRVVYLSPTTPLITGTILDNITLGGDIDPQRISATAEKLGLLDGSLPAGLATRIDKTTAQRDYSTFVKTITARTLVTDYDTLVVNGFTDELPTYEEAMIFDELINHSNGRLLVCSTRRLSATYGFTRLLQLEEGEIVADGTHEELSAAGSAYAFQVASQTQAGA